VTTEQIACKIEWIQIPAPDLEKARVFYSSLFGWEIEEYSPDYLIFKSGSVQGGFSKDARPCDSGITFSITVGDIPETLKKVVSAGGKVVKEKTEIGGGFFASFKDPNGNTVELWSEQ